MADRQDIEPVPSDFPGIAAALAPRIATFAEEIEEHRRLPPALLESLFEARLFRMLLPKSLGGGEAEPSAFVETIERIARADASTAWCLSQAAGCAMVAGFLGESAAREIFGDRMAVLAWGPGPGKAVLVEGGYRVTGNWSFASGGRHASWLGGQCSVVGADGAPRRSADGKPETRTMLFPAAAARMTDVWQVIGLRGTASDSFAVEGLFVPSAHSVARDDQRERRETGPLYWFPTSSIYSSGFAGVALGIARALLGALIALARDKTPRGFRHRLAESATAQQLVAQLEARLGGARAYLHGVLADAWRFVSTRDTITMEQRIMIRLASSHAIQEATAVADAAYHAAGASAVFRANPFERRFRDMHAVAQQLQGRLSHFETVGQYLFGLEPDPAAFL